MDENKYSPAIKALIFPPIGVVGLILTPEDDRSRLALVRKA